MLHNILRFINFFFHLFLSSEGVSSEPLRDSSTTGADPYEDKATRLYGTDEIPKLARKPKNGKSRVWSLLPFEKYHDTRFADRCAFDINLI
jgi:hypothetical protein